MSEPTHIKFRAVVVDGVVHGGGGVDLGPIRDALDEAEQDLKALRPAYADGIRAVIVVREGME